ncbi:anaphase-promoting complex subunit 3 [Nematocida sp. AWRm80]|nr:anaphase-promoting complex subunit 3 [Nematocida sp. AWRm80]
MGKAEEFLFRCIKYERYDDAIFSVESQLAGEKSHWEILLGYLFMKKKEYRRAILYFSSSKEYTAIYYRGMCYKHLEENEKAKEVLNMLLTMPQTKKNVLTSLESLYIIEPDEAMVQSHLGDLSIQTMCYDDAIKAYHAASVEEPLLHTAYRAILEDSLNNHKKQEVEEENKINIHGNTKKKEKPNRSIKTLTRQITERLESKPGRKIASILTALKNEGVLLEQVSEGDMRFVNKPEMYSTVPLKTLTALATYVYETGYFEKAARIFDAIRRIDPCCIDNMHYYTSILWHQRDETTLCALARSILGVNVHSYVSWAALGNHFSVHRKTSEAVECFERSLAIKKDPYVLCLLGHEYFMNSNLTESLKCFMNAIKMKAGHYNGIAGCGMIYEKIGKIESAEFCFMKAIRCNPQNILLGYLAVKFLVDTQKTDNAYSLLQKYLGIKESIEELIQKIDKFSWQSSIIKSLGYNEQLDTLLGPFLLELSQILLARGYTDCASFIIKQTTGKGRLFTTRKTQILDAISKITIKEEGVQ